MNPLRTIALTFTVACCALPAFAQTTASAGTTPKSEMVALESEPGLKAFLDEFFAASNARDLKKLEAMHHPNDWKAVTSFVAQKPAAFDTLTLENMVCKGVLPEKHGPYEVKRFLPGSPLPGGDSTDWPVRPAMEVNCSYQDGPNSIGTATRYLVRENGKWLVVNGVPSASMIQKMTGGK